MAATSHSSAQNVTQAAQCCLPLLGLLWHQGDITVPIAVPCLATATWRRDSHRPWLLRIRAISVSGR